MTKSYVPFPLTSTPLAPVTNTAVVDWSALPNSAMSGMPNITETINPSMWSSMQNWMKDSGFLGSTDAKGIQTQGWGMPALGAMAGLGNAFMSMKQYGVAKDTLNENKRQFELNYDAQRKTTNSALADRQAARVAASSSSYQSVADYMAQYGIK